MSSMAISPLVTLFFSMFLVLQSTTNAFNITQILNPYRQFGEYNSYLTEAGIANDINNQKAVTVLVVSDDQLYYFKHLPGDVVKSIMNFHVLLGYYDESKLKSLKSKTILATFNQDATLTVDHDSSGSITFKSADSGPNMGVKLLSTVETLPPSISVLQIESIVKTNGGGENRSPLNPPTGWTASPPRKALAPPPDSRNKTPPTPNSSPNTTSNTPQPASSPSTKGNNNAPSPSKTKPSSAPSSQTPSKSNSTSPPPDASSPGKSLGPTSSDHESSVASPPKPSNTPPAADVQAPSSDKKSSAHARISCGNYLGSILMVFSAVWYLFSMS